MQCISFQIPVQTNSTICLFQVSNSNWNNVTLVHADRGTSGEFKCEVTADAPLFQTEARDSALIVAGTFIICLLNSQLVINSLLIISLKLNETSL